MPRHDTQENMTSDEFSTTSLVLSTILLVSLTLAIIVLFLHRLYHCLLPTSRPAAETRYNEATVRKTLNDVPGMMSHIKNAGGTFSKSTIQ